MTKQETINKYKNDFKKHVESMGLDWIEDNFVVEHKDDLIHSIDIDDINGWEGSNGYVEKEYKDHDDDCGCCNDYLIEGMYDKKTKKLIADDYDNDHTGEFYGDYWFSMKGGE